MSEQSSRLIIRNLPKHLTLKRFREVRKTLRCRRLRHTGTGASMAHANKKTNKCRQGAEMHGCLSAGWPALWASPLFWPRRVMSA